MANWRLGLLWCNGYSAPTIPCLAFHIIPHWCSVLPSTQGQVQTTSPELPVAAFRGNTQLQPKNSKSESCRLPKMEIECALSGHFACMHVCVLCELCLCLHSWSVWEDKRCVPWELTFHPLLPVPQHLWTDTRVTFNPLVMTKRRDFQIASVENTWKTQAKPKNPGRINCGRNSSCHFNERKKE